MTVTQHRQAVRGRTVLDLPLPEPGWRAKAACRGLDPSVFWLGPGRGPVNPDAEDACAVCPVTSSCLIDAARDDDQATYRAAMKPRARNDWLRKQGISRPGSYAATKRAKIPTDEFVRLTLAGADPNRIAALLGCSPTTVVRRLKAARAEGLIP